MIQLTINTIMFIISFLFMQMKHPMSMGLMLLCQTLLISMIIGLNYKTFWFSYILFLIFIGGMMIMFIYMISLSSNEMFKLKKLPILYIIIMMSLLILILFSMDLFYLNFMKSMEMNNFINVISMMNNNSLSLNKIYNYPTNLITLLLILYLLLTLVIIVKITNFLMGPLRSMP
nr:NADH dehydrogenase subunit 6 [Azana sp. WQY005]